jgi:hypothetical protein
MAIVMEHMEDLDRGRMSGGCGEPPVRGDFHGPKGVT